MDHLPAWIGTMFSFTVFITVYIFYKASVNSKITIFIIIGWMLLQAMAAISGFYTITNQIPPRFSIVILLPMLFIIFLFTSVQGKMYLDGLDLKILTLLHVVRLPVELVLFFLCTYKTVPELMTFGGRNFDILAGITAPLIFYFGFVKKSVGQNIMLCWNFLCLGLLINIVVNAILSAPSPFQQFAFNQPNIAVLYFPYVWLPCCIVPLVLLSHLASIRQLIIYRKRK